MSQPEEPTIDHENDPLKKIPLITAVHPDNAPYFREIAASKKEIRTNRSNMEHACANCTKLSNENTTLLKCARVSNFT
jgi:hypothetical protein